MKRTILALSMLVMLVACKKEPSETIDFNKEEKLSTDIEVKVTGETQETKPLYQWSPTYNFLGYGYDVTDEYNSQASIRASVIDISKFANRHPGLFNFNKSTEGSWETILANNAVDLSEKFAYSSDVLKKMRVFGKTIEKAFPGTVVSDKKYVYGYYSRYAIWKRCNFYYDNDVNDFLTTDFKRDITLLSAKELVDKYGTHMLTGIKIGSKFNVLYQAEAPEAGRELISREGLRYVVKRTFGLPTGYLDEPNLRDLNANTSTQIYYNSVGGDISTLKPEIINKRVFVNITNWVATITEANAKFIGPLGRDRGLTPLYSLIFDTVKKAEVKAYIEKYIAENEIKLKN